MYSPLYFVVVSIICFILNGLSEFTIIHLYQQEHFGSSDIWMIISALVYFSFGITGMGGHMQTCSWYLEKKKQGQINDLATMVSSILWCRQKDPSQNLCSQGLIHTELQLPVLQLCKGHISTKARSYTESSVKV